MAIKVTLNDGKYTLHMNDQGKMTALRHGETWDAKTSNLIGDNVTAALLHKIEDLALRLKSRGIDAPGVETTEDVRGDLDFQSLSLTPDNIGLAFEIIAGAVGESAQNRLLLDRGADLEAMKPKKLNVYYIHNNGSHTFVKEEEFFKQQGGEVNPWGKSWIRVEATSIEAARAMWE